MIMAETNGFELIRSKKQLISCAGLDVKEKESGTSVKGNPDLGPYDNPHYRRMR